MIIKQLKWTYAYMYPKKTNGMLKKHSLKMHDGLIFYEWQSLNGLVTGN